MQHLLVEESLQFYLNNHQYLFIFPFPWKLRQIQYTCNPNVTVTQNGTENAQLVNSYLNGDIHNLWIRSHHNFGQEWSDWSKPQDFDVQNYFLQPSAEDFWEWVLIQSLLSDTGEQVVTHAFLHTAGKMLYNSYDITTYICKKTHCWSCLPECCENYTNAPGQTVLPMEIYHKQSSLHFYALICSDVKDPPSLHYQR